MGTADPRSPVAERPAHRVKVDGFWIDEHPVTNREFTAFTEATGYVTTAERAPDWEELRKHVPPGTPPPDPALLVARVAGRCTSVRTGSTRRPRCLVALDAGCGLAASGRAGE